MPRFFLASTASVMGSPGRGSGTHAHTRHGSPRRRRGSRSSRHGNPAPTRPGHAPTVHGVDPPTRASQSSPATARVSNHEPSSSWGSTSSMGRCSSRSPNITVPFSVGFEDQSPLLIQLVRPLPAMMTARGQQPAGREADDEPCPGLPATTPVAGVVQAAFRLRLRVHKAPPDTGGDISHNTVKDFRSNPSGVISNTNNPGSESSPETFRNQSEPLSVVGHCNHHFGRPVSGLRPDG